MDIDDILGYSGTLVHVLLCERCAGVPEYMYIVDIVDFWLMLRILRIMLILLVFADIPGRRSTLYCIM